MGAGALRPARPTAVRELGAEPVRGDLGDAAVLERGARGADTVFHAAAKVEDWGDVGRLPRASTSRAPKALLAAARAAGVRRFVHVGTEAALLRGQPLVHADERTPLAFDSPAPLRGHQGRRRGGRAGRARASRRSSSARASCGARATPRSCPAMVEHRAQRALPLGRRRPPPHLDHPRRQLRPRARAGGRPRHAGLGLLRHRRRAGRVPRVRHRAARHRRASRRPTAASRRSPPARSPPPARPRGARSRCRERRRSPASPPGSPRSSARSTTRAPAPSSATRRS